MGEKGLITEIWIKVYIIYLIRHFFPGLPNIPLSGSLNSFIPSHTYRSSLTINVADISYSGGIPSINFW
jgi:hypothetical protein